MPARSAKIQPCRVITGPRVISWMFEVCSTNQDRESDFSKKRLSLSPAKAAPSAPGSRRLLMFLLKVLLSAQDLYRRLQTDLAIGNWWSLQPSRWQSVSSSSAIYVWSGRSVAERWPCEGVEKPVRTIERSITNEEILYKEVGLLAPLVDVRFRSPCGEP